MTGTNRVTAWSRDDLERIGDAEELQLASCRADGTLRPYVTMWVVGAAGSLYVRSAYGPDNPWYRRAVASGTGRIRAGGLERDVAFGQASADVQADVDAAYHAKYDRYGARIVGSVTGPGTYQLTIRLVPQPADLSEVLTDERG
jgi:hypothetical protein